VALHGIYAETGGKKVERDRLGPEHFSRWMQWAKERGLALDFNQTYFSHPMAESGFTLSSRDPKVRTFWVEHSIRCREIGEAFGRAQGSPCVVNLWIQDGYKDTPVDRLAPRALLKESLDRIFARKIDPRFERDSVEGKLFGIGSESYVVGSHEFYLGYALKNDLMLTLDMGHFHPTESVADKLSAVLLFGRDLFLHISRGVRWDSDHVVTLSDDVRAVASEIARADAWKRVNLGLDYFDASINRIAAWVIGARAALKAILAALLEPTEMLRREEASGNHTRRLAFLEELKDLPCGAVWDRFCLSQGVPAGAAWLRAVEEYEKRVLAGRR
jgi:L-rhamnose isomerase